LFDFLEAAVGRSAGIYHVYVVVKMLAVSVLRRELKSCFFWSYDEGFVCLLVNLLSGLELSSSVPMNAFD